MAKIVIPPRGAKGAAPLGSKKAVVLPPRVALVVPKPRLTDALDARAFNKQVLPSKAVGFIPPRPESAAKVNSTGIILNINELLEKHPLPPLPTGREFVLKDWQVQDIETLVMWDRIALFLPVGAGKTVVATLIGLAWGDEIRIVLVPPIIIPQWVRWINSIPGSGGAFAYKTPNIKKGDARKAKERRRDMDMSASWWIMSFDIFKRDFSYLVQLVKGKDVTLVIDEAHAVKNTASKMFKLSFSFSVGRKLCLMTGTELNKPADAYAYVQIKTPGAYRDHRQFENIHVKEKDFFGKVVEWQNLELMHDNLYVNSAHRTKEDVHAHLPQANYIPFPYDLAPEHKRLYDELALQQLLELEDGGKIDATTTQTLIMNCQRMVVNWGKYAQKEGLRPAAFDVIDTLVDMLEFGEGGPQKMIVWTWFIDTTETVTAYLESKWPGRVATAYSGSNSVKQVERFMEDPECWWLVAQPRSAGAGLNPQYICYNALFLETPSESILFRQSAGRIDREGQQYNANIWIGIANGTAQEGLYQNLLSNDELVQKVKKNVHDLRRLIMGG